MKPLVIYHASCADGFGAAYAAWLKLGDDAEYVPMQYGFTETPDYVGRKVYMLDFSWPRDKMDDLFKTAEFVVWRDHHKTAFEMWCGEYEKGMRFTDNLSVHDIILDDNKSGAYLAWEFFHPGTDVPMFIKHIDDYDRWQFKLNGTKAFQKALWSYAPWSFQKWLEIIGDPEYDEAFFLYNEGEAILRAHEQNVQSVVNSAARKCLIQTRLDGMTLLADFHGLAANCPPHLQSDVGHELATRSSTFGLLWSIDKNNVCKCSLRSNGDYDVSAIAKSFGGGGHRNAAGFTINIQTLLEWIK